LNTNSKGLLQVEWCPRRSGVLASISREEKSIKFWDIQDAMIGQRNEKEDFSNLSSHSRPYRSRFLFKQRILLLITGYI
jgi:hypothetical protein